MCRSNHVSTWIAIVFLSGTFLLGQDAWPPCEVVNFPDPNLEEAIRQNMNQPEGDICASELKDLEELYAPSYSISDLSGLEFCTGLISLNLDTNQVGNIDPLAGLTNLTRLFLYFNEISDLSPLANLTNLEELGLDSNQITDIGPLSGLTNLAYLLVAENQVSDVTPLTGLLNLDSVDLRNNQITDIDPLVGLTNLHRIFLSSNQISDVYSLVENSGIGSGDAVALDDNPLSGTSCSVYIPQLESRGVTVADDCP
jgi:internalin A